MKQWLTIWFCAFTLSITTAWAAPVPTAKQALEIAKAKFGAGPTNQMIRMEGAVTDSDLQPRQWDVTFYDAKRNNKGTVIRVKDGAVISVAGAVRIIDDARMSDFLRNFTGYDPSEIMNLARWKIDSNAVLTKLAALPGLDKVHLTDVTMVLQKLSDGDVAPVWHVKVRARLRSQPGHEGWIGSVDLSAETGEILKNELNVDRLSKSSLF